MSNSRSLSRRQFIGLAGAGAIATSAACVAGAASYLLLRRSPRGKDADSTSTMSAPRSTQLKTIARPPITSRQAWGAREPDHTAENESGFYGADNTEGWREYGGDLRGVYRTVIVHHSVEYDTDDLSTVREIQNLHMDDRGWADIAYHFIVGRSGEVFEGRALNVRGTHVEGFNTGSVGVVFLGNFEITSPTVLQLQTGQQLIDWLALRLELTHLAGHYQFNSDTVCPGATMIPSLAGLAAAAGLTLGTEGYVPPID